MPEITVRAARGDDADELAALDLHYDASRVLRLERDGIGAETAFRFRWMVQNAPPSVYAEYAPEQLRGAIGRVDAFFVAEHLGELAGLLMIIVPGWTDAGEITDLAVGREHRRSGAGRALVDAAIAFAHGRGLRALWVEPRSDNAAAIDFYLALGFRLSGFNDRMYGVAGDGDVTLFMYLDL